MMKRVEIAGGIIIFALGLVAAICKDVPIGVFLMGVGVLTIVVAEVAYQKDQEQQKLEQEERRAERTEESNALIKLATALVDAGFSAQLSESHGRYYATLHFEDCIYNIVKRP